MPILGAHIFTAFYMRVHQKALYQWPCHDLDLWDGLGKSKMEAILYLILPILQFSNILKIKSEVFAKF
jgi:hypothetical protein